MKVYTTNLKQLTQQEHNENYLAGEILHFMKWRDEMSMKLQDPLNPKSWQQQKGLGLSTIQCQLLQVLESL